MDKPVLAYLYIHFFYKQGKQCTRPDFKKTSQIFNLNTVGLGGNRLYLNISESRKLTYTPVASEVANCL